MRAAPLFAIPAFPRSEATNGRNARSRSRCFPAPAWFADEEHLLSLIRAGEDGLILEADGRCATFLPQVWEGFPDKRAFLAALVKKAGLPADTRLARCRISRYGVVKFDGR
jgi:AMMECR1 domain-containing protein